ncbi:MAG: hypothetical protein GX587_04680 [Bacteroidales bacterium]|nr:hypothetical protein [Bacteroidales bacterium]
MKQSFRCSLKKNTANLAKILNSDLPIFDKIQQYVGAYIDIMVANPLLVSFFISILHRNPDTIMHVKNISNLYSTDSFIKQLKAEASMGNIRNIEPSHFFVDMISLILFPFAIKSLIMDKNKFSATDYSNFISSRKEWVADSLIRTLRP